MSYIKQPTVEALVRDLQRKEYIKAMKETEYGWKPKGRYSHVGCPSDLQFISDSDLPHKTKCIVDCKECWEYVLENKWG